MPRVPPGQIDEARALTRPLPNVVRAWEEWAQEDVVECTREGGNERTWKRKDGDDAREGWMLRRNGQNAL